MFWYTNLFNFFASITDTMTFARSPGKNGITQAVSAAIIERGNRLVMSYRSKNDNDRYVAYHFSKKDKALISSLMYKIVDGKIVLLQSMNKIVCDQEISLEEILAEPKK